MFSVTGCLSDTGNVSSEAGGWGNLEVCVI
jgi:hypothetical protein